MIKIMYIANGNGLSDKIGGSLRRSIEIAKRLQQKGCEIHFLTTIGGYKVCTREGLKAKYYILPASIWKKKENSLMDRLWSYIITTITAFFRVSKLPRCNIVYSDSDYFCDTIPAVLYKKTSGVLWIAMTHHRIEVTKKRFRDFVISFLSSKVQSFSYILFKMYADKILVLRTDMGNIIRNCLISKGASLNKIEFTKNGVNLEILSSVDVQKKYDACFLGGLRPNKGLYDIVPIWKEVCKKRKDATLLLIGYIDHVYKKDLEKEINKNNLNKNIRILGFLEEKEKIRNLKMSKVFVFPSHEEGFGIAVLEAMACGLPVVVYDLPVYRIYGENVLRVPVGDINQFAEAVIRLLDDEDLRNNLALECQKFIQKYDWNKVVEEDLKVLKSIMGGKV